ncbi:hypothetical protein AMECASPLE_017243 [Ameca splendens]|uniref:Uncharacterized protein n=1 Tax=Ameca splendens TaxID=208324 RepID=A0ABV0ZM89_9TELE
MYEVAAEVALGSTSHHHRHHYPLTVLLPQLCPQSSSHVIVVPAFWEADSHTVEDDCGVISLISLYPSRVGMSSLTRSMTLWTISSQWFLSVLGAPRGVMFRIKTRSAGFNTELLTLLS